MPTVKRIVEMTPEEIGEQFGVAAVPATLKKVGDKIVVAAGRKRVTLGPDLVPPKSLAKLAGKEVHVILDKAGDATMIVGRRWPWPCFITCYLKGPKMLIHLIDPAVRSKVIDAYVKEGVLTTKIAGEIKKTLR